MELEPKDRIILINQLYILEKLYPDDQKLYENQRIALENGYELHYNDIYPYINEEIMTDKDCTFVLDVLSMYDLILISFENLESKEGLTTNDVKFKGFDGNHETKYMAYTRYYIENLERFDSIKETTNGYYNSHFPMNDIYKKKLEIFYSIDYTNHSRLDVQQIKSLI